MQTRDDGFELDSKQIGALPIVNRFIKKLKIDEFFDRFLPVPDKRTMIAPQKALRVLLRILVIERMPLYAAGDWIKMMVPSLLQIGSQDVTKFSDDRLGRALDRLFDADRSAFLTEFVLHMVRTFDIELEQFHNDSTTLTLHGEYPDADGKRMRGKPTVEVTYGHNKDHRPDLKQLLWILTVSADGAIPVHFKVTDGNQADCSTHIETWEILRKLVGSSEFVYVADSKLCTRGNLHHIDCEGGTFVTVMPRSRKEDALFKNWLQDHSPQWDEIVRKPHPRRVDGPLDIVQAMESPIPDTDGYRLIWFHSTHKRERDAEFRQNAINRALKQLDKLSHSLGGPRCRYTTRQGVAKKVDEILDDTETVRWIEYEIEHWEEERFRAEKRGRPGPDTRWRRQLKPRFELKWKVLESQLQYDCRTDGIFPLLTNDRNISALEVYQVYSTKQPLVEKRHHLLKNVQAATPVYLKNIGRLEAILFLYYLSVTIHALIEREIRARMDEEGIEHLKLYPEERKCAAPTANRIFKTFAPLQRHNLKKKGKLVQEFPPELTPLHRQVLKLLGITPEWFLRQCQ